MKQYLAERFSSAFAALGYTDQVSLAFERPKQDSHGDLTTNAAMLLAKQLNLIRRPYRQVPE